MGDGWIGRGRRRQWLAMVVLLVATLGLGCGAHFGVTPEGAKGVTFVLGQARVPGGLEGGAISVPGATLLSEVFEAAGLLVASFFGREPIVIEHRTEPPTPAPAAALPGGGLILDGTEIEDWSWHDNGGVNHITLESPPGWVELVTEPPG